MKAVIEGLLFLCGEDGISLEEIEKITELDIDEIKIIIKELYNDYISNNDRGIKLEYLGNKFKLTTKEEHKEYYKKLAKYETSELSQSALETLAIIAYNAPITRLDIDNIRGVNSSYVLRKLLLKGLIEDVGKSDIAGRPKLYNVTYKFLDYFGLGSIDDLPKIEKEETEIDDTSLFESKYKEND